MTASAASSVALLLHGKIGLWSIKSANVPHREKGPLSKTDRLLAHAVASAPQAAPVESNVSVWDLERRPHSMLLGFASFAAKSLQRRVIRPNRHAGLRLDVFLHSWHPEIGAELDRIYEPVASRHDPPQRIHKVASHHLSMRRGLALVNARATPSEGALRRPERPPYDLVMVARFDLIFFTDLLLAPLLGGAAIWLPTWCMRYPINKEQFSRLSLMCGGRRGGNAYVLVPPRVSTMHGWIKPSLRHEADDIDLAVLDCT